MKITLHHIQVLHELSRVVAVFILCPRHAGPSDGALQQGTWKQSQGSWTGPSLYHSNLHGNGEIVPDNDRAQSDVEATAVRGRQGLIN